MLKKLTLKLNNWWRFRLYSSYCNNKNVTGKYKAYQPVVLRGKGTIEFGNNVQIGVINSPSLYSSYAYIEARTPEAQITFGNNTSINNNFSVTAEKKITIGNDCLIGFNCRISDSNFHDLSPENRLETDANPKEVIISNNVFIGNDVTILKGVIIGENTVVAARSVVTKSFGDNLVVAGNPAKVVKEL